MIDSISLWILVVSLLIGYIINYIISKCQRDPRKVKFAETLPGPRGWPIIGNSLDFYKGDKLKLMIDYKEKYGDTYRLWLGKYLAITLSNIDEMETVFMSSKVLGKPKLFLPFQDFFGEGMFTTLSLSKWRKSKRLLQGSFGRSALPRYTTIINNKVEFLLNEMKSMNLVDGPEFDVFEHLANLANGVMLSTNLPVALRNLKYYCQSALNIDMSRDDKSLVEYYNAAISGFDLCFKKVCLPWLQYSVIDHLFYKKKARQYRKNMRDFLRKLVESKKREIIQQIEEHKNNSKSNSEDVPPKSVLTLAYEMAEMENDENIMLDELFTVLAGGGDPASMMALFLLAVAIHQNIQNKLYDEIFEVFGDSDRPADQNDLDRLPYLEQVLKETLRRFPIIPLMFRAVEEDVKIGNRVIPADTIVILSIAAVHFNPKFYPDPWKFNPDNFSAEVTDKRHKLAFLSFSAGSRGCMGMNFAMFEMKLTLVALLRNFAFHTKMKMEDIRMDDGFIMTSVDGYKLTITSRIKEPTYSYLVK